MVILDPKPGVTDKEVGVNFPLSNFSSQKRTEEGSEEDLYMTMDAVIQGVAQIDAGKPESEVHVLDHRRSGSFGIQDEAQSDIQKTGSTVLQPNDSPREHNLNPSEKPVHRNPVDRNVEGQYESLNQLTREDPTQDHIYTSIDPRYGHVMRQLDYAKENIQEVKTNLLSLKEKSESKCSICQTELKTDREETVRKITRMVNELYDELEKDLSDEKEKMDSNINDDIAALDENIDVVEDIRTNIMTETKTNEDLDDLMEMVDNMTEQIKLQLKKKKSYTHPEYNKGEITRDHVQKFIGSLTIKETNIPHIDETPENSSEEDGTYNSNFFV